jgi:hypothetical protein
MKCIKKVKQQKYSGASKQKKNLHHQEKTARKVVVREKEIWKKVSGYEGHYSVSSHGRIKVDKQSRWSFISYMLNPFLNEGYPTVILSKRGKRKTIRVHLIVAREFIGDRPEGFHTHHIDGDRGNPYYKNLKYLSVEDHVKLRRKVDGGGNIEGDKKKARVS